MTRGRHETSVETAARFAELRYQTAERRRHRIRRAANTLRREQMEICAAEGRKPDPRTASKRPTMGLGGQGAWLVLHGWEIHDAALVLGITRQAIDSALRTLRSQGPAW